MKPLLISSGEPAGIGPDLCIALADYEFPAVVLGDMEVMQDRAKQLGKSLEFIQYNNDKPLEFRPGSLTVLSIPCLAKVQAGKLNAKNSPYVIELLNQAAQRCSSGEFSALVTAPVHKAIINEAGIAFTGHTEFFESYFKVEKVVMMLACEQFRVALVTTHLPLRKVADAITKELLALVLTQLQKSLITDFGIRSPSIKIAGLNPHAGESGYLGTEEIDIIIPVIKELQSKGMNLQGPFPADTLFVPNQLKECDAFVSMYHDQGLPVLKYAGFGNAVNITLGLPIIRTSVDHGTALDLAGKGTADTGSLLAAVRTAIVMAKNRMSV